MNNTATYAWIVDVDHLSNVPLSSQLTESGINTRVGLVGPRNIDPERERMLRDNTATEVRRWRCKDDDGELCYEGRFIGAEDAIFAPLEDFAMPDSGATSIEYLNPQTGTWEIL